jgi:Kef-type K+ transport system membrane component KefB
LKIPPARADQKAEEASQSVVRLRELTFYTLAVLAGVAIFLFIRSIGQGLEAPILETPVGGPSVSSTNVILFHYLLALAVIIVTARVIGHWFKRLHQPPVIGELVGGIVLGPSLLGRLAPELSAQLLPTDIAPFLSVHAQLGVILYMFLVGLELDLRVIRHQGRATVAISHGSIILPFILGSVLALVLYPEYAGSSISFTAFALFTGVSLSVTAFPVLARILTDRGLSRTRMGRVALTCAAVDDATAWCLLAMVVSIAQAQMRGAVITIGLTLAFVLIVLLVVMPIVRRLIERVERSPALTPTTLSVVLAAVLASAVATEFIGIHALFGAFLLGAIVPNSSRLARDVRERLDSVVSVLFLPVFFAFSGMRTEIGLISGFANWALCIVIILTACAGKIGGSLLASRLVGLNMRDSMALSVLMNTRGLVELIVLNIGLDLKIISPELFTMLVLMALVTTCMTSPLLELLLKRHPWTEVNH